MMTRKITGLSEIIDDFDVVLFDAWGVLHDGLKAYPFVVETLQKLREASKKSIVVSNSPRLQDSVAETLSKNGVPEDAYDFLHSSGQEGVCFFNENDHLGKKCFHYGDISHRAFFDHVPLERVDVIEDAHFILNTGFLHDVGGQDEVYMKGIELQLPMVCLNPDISVLIGSERKFCAGHYARAYREKGGNVTYIGKPYPEIYRRALTLSGVEAGTKSLIIGDSFETDLRGGQSSGIPTILTMTGIYADRLVAQGSFNQEGYEKLCEDYGLKADYVIDQVRF